MRRSNAPILLVAGVALALAACARTDSLAPEGAFERPPGTARVLLMPPDVELYELTAGGLTEPQAQWTEAAKGNLADAITAIIEERDADLVPFAAVGDDPLTPHPYTQVVKLHEAVGRTILVHGYLPGLSLPTRKDRFDWSLGPDVVPMGEAYQADYALFVYARESFSTSGRVALVIIGALLGAYVPGGQQVGFASLVDLRSGDLVWFNQATAAIGDLREPDSARTAAGNLLDDLPL